MMLVGACVVTLITVLISEAESNPISFNSYENQREQLIEDEENMRVGGNVSLNVLEETLNQFILQEKRRTIEESRVNRTVYIPALSFFRSKSWIESTPIFQIIKAMPKGACLHLHDPAIASLDWVVKNLTYRDKAYMCVDQDNFIQLGAFNKDPPRNPACEWSQINAERSSAENVEEFDQHLKDNISMLTTDPLETYPTLNSVWRRFDKYFAQIGSILDNTDFRRDYYRQALEEIRADNVQYIEIRSGLSGYLDENDVPQDDEYGLNMYKYVTDQFVQDYPDFSGAKFILSGNRGKSVEKIREDVEIAMYLRQKYPDFLVGYDLVSQEDPNHSLLDYIDNLLLPSQQDPPVNLPYFFHAGETNWQGTEVDFNLLDALLLNAHRIGHGFGLTKHPGLIPYFKAKGVAVEINPISNQILGLVADLRNHPGAQLIAENVPVVVSSDDPRTWDASPLSHDFYLTFVNLIGENDGLSVLKQLAINSIKYSAMSDDEKSAALQLWEAKWHKFVQDMIETWRLSTIQR